MSAIYPPGVAHVHTVIGVSADKVEDLLVLEGEMASVVLDGYIKILGKDDVYFDTIKKFPLVNGDIRREIAARALLLNAVSCHYAVLWDSFNSKFTDISWTKNDPRLPSNLFSQIKNKWNFNSFAKDDFSRRQLLLEIDVLVAMGIGLNLKQLTTLYRLQFPVMQQYENDTWYDSNGRIVFSAKNMGDLTYKRPEWEKKVKDAPEGKRFYRTINDDTMPGGPVERTIEYVAPFDRCDREQDYETAWKFFEEKYGKN